jgi:hypothetical protein
MPYFTPPAFYLFLKIKSELASRLLPQEPSRRAFRGRPHYRYRRARRHRPAVDRVLQKKTQLADDHG